MYGEIWKLLPCRYAGVPACFLTQDYQTSFKLRTICTIYIEELFVILKALECVNEINTNKYLVITDCISDISELKRQHSGHPALQLINRE